MDTTKEKFGRIATTPEEQAQNRLNLQQGLAKQGIATTTVNNNITPITSELLKSGETTYKLPKVTTPTTADGIIGTVTSSNEQLTKQIETERANAEKAKLASQGDVQSTMDEIMGVQTSRAKVEEDLGIPKLAQDVTAITNEIESVQRAQQNELKALESSNMTDAGRAAASRDINRKYASNLADLSIVQSARNRNYTTAQAIADRKIELKLEPLKLKLDYQKAFYEENKENFSESRKRDWELKLKNSEREINKQEATEKSLRDSKMKYIEAANSTGLGLGVLTSLQKAETEEELLQIVSKNNIVTLEDKIKKATLDKLNIEKNTTNVGKVVKINGKDYIQKADGTLVEPTVPNAGQDKNVQAVYKDTINQIDELSKAKGLYGAVGPNAVARSSLDFNVLTGVRGDFIAGISQITNQKTIDNLIAVKQAGGTFGALSEKELSLLQQSASRIGSWEVKDKSGKVIGYNTTEKSFKDELAKLKTATERFLNADGGLEANYLDSIDSVLQEETSPYLQAGYNLN